jgi:hypothetical protein
MKFVQHIKEIFFVENGGQRNSHEENEKKLKISQKITRIVDLCIEVLEIIVYAFVLKNAYFIIF